MISSFILWKGKSDIGARPLFIEHMDLTTMAQYDIGA